MKRFLFALALFLLPSAGFAQCNGPFSNNTVCGNVTGASDIPRQTPFTSFSGPAPLNRIQLTAPLTLFVNPSSSTSANCNAAGTGGAGNDSTGLGTLAAPYQTPNKALAVALANYDVRQSQITIQYCDNNVTAATYGQLQMTSNLVGAVSGGNATTAQLIVQGNTSTPANVIVQGSGGVAAFGFVAVTSPVSIKDLQIGSTLIGGATTGHGISADARSMVYYANITWGFIATSHSHINATFSSFVEQEGVERINGGAALHWNGDRSSTILTTGNTITCTGTPAFPSAFIALTNGSTFTLNGAAFSGCGGVTGPRYISDLTSSFGSGSADPNSVYPGNSNGNVPVPSFNLTGLLVGGGGGPTGSGVTVAAMPAMNGDCTITLTTGAIVCLNTAWAQFTSTPTCGTATITTNTSRSKTVGKVTFIQIDYTITAIGTCAVTALTFTLPNTANFAGGLAGRETVNSNKGVNCSMPSGGTTGSCFKADATAWAVNDRIFASGVYENQ